MPQFYVAHATFDDPGYRSVGYKSTDISTSRLMNKKTTLSKNRAKHFEATRAQHSLEAAEDYTELIYDLIEKSGEARTGEIARHLGISHVTALRTIKRLQEQGYVKTENHRPVSLTAKGEKLAKATKERHRILVEFFVSIGVPSKVAEFDVEGIEHHVSETTLRAIVKFMNK